MNITDELRKWWVRKFPVMDKELHKDFTAIADRIDAEHEDQLLGERNIAYNAGYDEGFASADDWLAQHEDAMAEHGWVRGPLDADGVPWHIGDRTESGQTVGAMGLNKHGWHFIGTVNEIDPSIHRHYHAPTVEDVLREFALACEDAGNAGPEVARIAADYAKRLTLAVEEDA